MFQSFILTSNILT